MPSFKVNAKWAKLTPLTDFLYISGVIAVRPRIIVDLKISHIVNATFEVPSLLIPGVETRKLWLEDTNETKIFHHLDLIADLIDSVRSRNEKILIHCVAGVSRSATLCLAYLMKYEGKSLREAYDFLASVRPMVRPNLGFWKALIDYEKALRGRNSVRFLGIQGSDQQLPDVYITQLPIAEDPEGEENEAADPDLNEDLTLIPSKENMLQNLGRMHSSSSFNSEGDEGGSSAISDVSSSFPY
jgi:atypical dual specificity phosphatase